MKKNRGKPETPILLVSSHIQNEDFFPKLKSQEFTVYSFNEVEKKWDDPLDRPGVYLLDERFLLQEFNGLLDLFFQSPVSRPVIVIGKEICEEYLAEIFPDRVFRYLKRPVDLTIISDAIRQTLGDSDRQTLLKEYEKKLEFAQREIRDLREIGLALSSERDTEALLELILTKSRQLVGADAASIYLTEQENKLRFCLTQNASLDWQIHENILIPIGETSIAGYVAKTANSLNLLDVYIIPERYPFTFNRSFDEKSGYRCKSMLVVPMKNLSGDVLGVIQLINKRSDFESLRPGEKLREEVILPFSRSDLDLLQSLASQAAVALENSRLYAEIKNLFEGFVKASIIAIEARDPATCGHSERVASLTVAFAKKIHDYGDGQFGPVRFSSESLTEIRYAALLHDFGKVGVREEILTKAKKLFPHELENLKQRYQILRKAVEADFYKDCYHKLLEMGKEAFSHLLPSFETNFKLKMKELDETLAFLINSNEPSVLEEGNFNHLLEIAKMHYTTSDDERIEYLNEREAHVLSIRKGSLSEEERMQIESHVIHSFNFLSKIPWTRELKRIPEIAYAHHEKLNGRGYPNHLEDADIPLEAKLMAISDIYDSLTALDRPYKRALPKEKAIDIMYFEAKGVMLSKPLLDIFVGEKIYEAADKKL